MVGAPEASSLGGLSYLEVSGHTPTANTSLRPTPQPLQTTILTGKENVFAGSNSPSVRNAERGSCLQPSNKREETQQRILADCPERTGKTSSLGDRVRAEAAKASAAAQQAIALVAATTAVFPSSSSTAEGLRSPLSRWPGSPSLLHSPTLMTGIQPAKDVPDIPLEMEPLRQRFRSLSAALRSSNQQQAELQALLAKTLDKLETVKAEEAETRRLKEHHHHRWCVLDQEREGLQRVAQQAQASERSARTAERTALEESAAWRRWLASFLDVLLRRGASGLDADVSTSQSLQDRQPRLHLLLNRFSKASEMQTLQPELLSELPSFYEHITELIGDGSLSLTWRAPRTASEAKEEKQKALAADERVLQLEKKLAQKEIAFVALEHEKRSLRGEVRALQNLVQELRGSIRVFCRLRPPRKGSPAITAESLGARAESSQRISLRKPPGDRRHDFTFDRVFQHQACQRDLYEELEPLLPGILEGIHVCIFAYGQTGSGKTYTLAGNRTAGEPGIQDLAIADLLRLAECRDDSAGSRYDVRLTALEIYNESIQDLLVDAVQSASTTFGGVQESSSDGPRLEVRQSREGLNSSYDGELGAFGGAGVNVPQSPSPFGSMRVPGLRSWKVRGQADVDRALEKIASNRHVSATVLNERSSRSHCVLSLTLVRTDEDAVREEGSARAGVLHIVDLAGSERTKLSQAEGLQMKEANCINRSLSALSDVLYALGDSNGAAHIPYRNSKLTYLLQDALGGSGCKTFLFAQISPEAVDSNESYSTLTFASKVATSVQKGRLRPPIPNGSPQLRGSPALRHSRDASPISQASDSVDGPLMSSPTLLRSRDKIPALPGSSSRTMGRSSSTGTPEKRARSRG